MRFAAAQTMSVAETGGGGASVTNLTVLAASTDYYWTSTTSALTTIGTNLGASALNATYSLTVSDGDDSATGKVTISATGGSVTSFAITAVSSPLQGYLGWTNADITSFTGALTYTGSEHAENLFLPNVVRANPMGPDGDAGVEVTDGTISISQSGASKALYYDTRYIDNLEFQYLTGKKSFVSYESTANESLQKFFQDAIRNGYPVRYHKDRSDDSTYVTYRILRLNELGIVSMVQPPVWGASGLFGWRSDVIKLV